MPTRKKEPDLPGASDPVKPPGGKRPDDHGDHAKGTPSSDRHAAETLAGRLQKSGPAEKTSK